MRSVPTHGRNIVALCGHRPELTNILPRRRATNYNNTVRKQYAKIQIMTQQEYEQKRRECWEEYVNMLNINTATRYVFDKIFDRAYALGKQEKDADTVIVGWVAIDEAYGQCFLHTEKPIQKAQPIADTGDYDTVWDSKGKTYLLDAELFPDMDSDSEPQEAEIIIKRKKK